MLKRVFLKHQTVRTDAAAGEKSLIFFLTKGVGVLVGNIGGNVVFFEL